MPTGTLAIVSSIGGKTLQKTISETYDHPNNYEDIPLAAGQTATAWVKTDADTAACNLTTGHGYTTGKADVYWTGGMRHDVDMTVSTNALTLEGGTGTDFPETAATGVIVCKVQQINTAIDGDNVQILTINSTKRGSVYFEDVSGGSVKQIELVGESPYTYTHSSGETSPLTGNPITVCYASNGTTTAAVLDILVGEDSTP